MVLRQRGYFLRASDAMESHPPLIRDNSLRLEPRSRYIILEFPTNTDAPVHPREARRGYHYACHPAIGRQHERQRSRRTKSTARGNKRKPIHESLHVNNDTAHERKKNANHHGPGDKVDASDNRKRCLTRRCSNQPLLFSRTRSGQNKQSVDAGVT